jgi:hypothetical protein
VSVSGCACLSAPPPPPCGGPCPPGSVCWPYGVPGFPPGCYPQNCSATPCPAGSVCQPLGGGMYCAPIPCSGGSGYPTCDGACSGSDTCQAYVSVGGCYCTPGSPSGAFVD